MIPPISSPKHKLKPNATHKTLIKPKLITLWNTVEIMFYDWPYHRKNPKAGVIINTKAEATIIQAVSPVLISPALLPVKTCPGLNAPAITNPRKISAGSKYFLRIAIVEKFSWLKIYFAK